MPKQVIVSMENNYPFGECEECTNENTKVLVRKIYQASPQQRKKLLEKVSILRRLKNQHMIKIDSVLEEEDSIHFMFEYIPIKVETWISNINDQFIETFRDQLIKFSSFLANNAIKIHFQLKNIGMGQNYDAKYFLDLDFQVDSSVNRQKLKSAYIREITSLFRPYLMHQKQQGSLDEGDQPNFSRNSTNVKASFEDGGNKKVASPDVPAKANKNKEKVWQQYCQEVNMSYDYENEKLLQEFMNVLDNDEEEEPYSSQKPPQIYRHSDFQVLRNNQNQGPRKEQRQQLSKENPLHLQKKQSHEKKAIPNGQNIERQLTKQGSPLSLQSLGLLPSAKGKDKRETMDYTEFARESIQMQSRVSSIIERSKKVIRKFREINNGLKS